MARAEELVAVGVIAEALGLEVLLERVGPRRPADVGVGDAGGPQAVREAGEAVMTAAERGAWSEVPEEGSAR